MATSRKIPLICSGHSRPVPELNYSKITADGFFIVSACLDGKAQMRNGETGDWIGTFVGHKGAVWSSHLNSTALKALTGSADYTCKIWNALTGEELGTINHPRIVKNVRFSSDDQFILSGCQDKIIRIFDSNNNSQIIQFEGHSDSIKNSIWSQNDDLIFSSSTDGVRVWDRKSGKEIKRINSIPTNCIEFSFDNKYLSVVSSKTVSFYNSTSFELEKQYNVGVEANGVSVSPDSKNFVVGGNDGSVRTFEFSSGKEIEVLRGHHGPVHCVRFAPDGITFGSGSEDGTIRLWLHGDVKSYGLWQEKDPNQNQTQTQNQTQNQTNKGESNKVESN